MAEPNGVSQKLWLTLLKEGGRHSANEIAKLANEHNGASIYSVLSSMVDTQALRQYDKGDGRHIRFGVTASCRVPRGVTIGDILSCNLTGAE